MVGERDASKLSIGEIRDGLVSQISSRGQSPTTSQKESTGSVPKKYFYSKEVMNEFDLKEKDLPTHLRPAD